MKVITALFGLLLVTYPAAARLQERPWELVGELVSIEDGDDRPTRLAFVSLSVREFPSNNTTDDRGLFAIRLPAEAKPGQEVRLIHDKAGYEIFFPYGGFQRLPERKDPPAQVVV